MWDDLRSRLRPEPDRYSTGVPVTTGADFTVAARQPVIGLALILLAAMSVDPLGLSGRGLLGTVLLAVCSVFTLSRTVSDRIINSRLRLVVAVIGAVASGMLYGFDPGSWGISFAIVLAVHAGIRFEAPLATALGVLVSTTAVVTLVAIQPYDIPWWVGVWPGLAVVLGMQARNRTETLRSAHELIEQTQLAVLAEAKASALAERARVARDIHDVLAHSLSGVNMQLSMADALFDADRAAEGREAIRGARAMVVEGLEEARRAVSTLRNETIDLEPALRAMLTGDHERLEIIGAPALLDTTQTQTVVRAAQEALTNARRHAAGADVTMTLTYPSGHEQPLSLAVSNAAGSSAGATDGGGFGLVGMRERAALLGGAVTAGPTPDGGWRTRLSLPLSSVGA